jgi:long-subunit fatty acid transport protein
MRTRLFNIIVLLGLLSSKGYANYAEFFGASVSTSTIGNQANSNKHDPSNNYYIPALLARGEKITLSMSASSVSTSFEEITNVVIKNATNNATAAPEELGAVNTEYPNYLGGAVHIALPLANQSAGTVGISIFTPIGALIETNSGDAFLPEYVMYRSRYRRTVVHVNYAHPWSENFAFSIGAHVGFQVGADLGTQASVKNNNVGSSARAAAKVKPSLGIIISAVLNIESFDALTYFTFQQEMKSNLEANVAGELNNPLAALFNLNIESMIFYDPHILRAGFSKNINDLGLEIFLSGEYQLWGKYKTPVVRVGDGGGILEGSRNFEQITIKDILVLKGGLSKNITDDFKLHAGAAYRPTPFDSEFSGSGNSLDTDSLIFAGGLSYDMTLFGFDIEVGAGGQYHKLSEVDVTKTAGLETGGAGNKIGAGGFKIGGSVIVGTLGMRTEF